MASDEQKSKSTNCNEGSCNSNADNIKNDESFNQNDKEFEKDVQTSANSYLDAGDIRAHFVIDEGPLCEELVSNGYQDALNFGADGLLNEAKKLIDHQKNKALPEPLNEDEIMSVLVYTSVYSAKGCPYRDLRNSIREGKACGKWDRFMTHLVKALGKLDKEFGEGAFREKDYPAALFHGLHSVTKVKKFTMGGMQQFNYEGFISTTVDESVAHSFAHGSSVYGSSSGPRGNCVIKLTLNDSYLDVTAKSPKSGSLKNHKPHKFAGFVGDVSWISGFKNEKEYLIFPLETLPLISSTEELEGPIQKRYHVVTGGTSGQLSKSLELLYAKMRIKQKPVAIVSPLSFETISKSPELAGPETISLKLAAPQQESAATDENKTTFVAEGIALGTELLKTAKLKPTPPKENSAPSKSKPEAIASAALAASKYALKPIPNPVKPVLPTSNTNKPLVSLKPTTANCKKEVSTSTPVKASTEQAVVLKKTPAKELTAPAAATGIAFQSITLKPITKQNESAGGIKSKDATAETVSGGTSLNHTTTSPAATNPAAIPKFAIEFTSTKGSGEPTESCDAKKKQSTASASTSTSNTNASTEIKTLATGTNRSSEIYVKPALPLKPRPITFGITPKGESLIIDDRTNRIRVELKEPNEAFLKLPVDLEISKCSRDMSLYKSWNWLAELFALSERQLLNVYGNSFDDLNLEGFSVQEIENAFKSITLQTNSKPSTNNSLQIHIVCGLDALLLPTAKRAAGGFVQVASQFNARVSPGTERVSLAHYASHSGQGPRVMMPCAHALLLREISDFDAFKDVLPDKATREKYIKYGFVQWGTAPEELSKLLTPEALKKLRVLFMWAKPELGEEPIIQVFTAAAPTNSFGNSGNDRIQREIATRLLALQYRAIAQLAVIRSRLQLSRVPLHLTLVGIGAFNNSLEVIDTALQEVAKVLESEPVDLYIHAYDYEDTYSISHEVLEAFVSKETKIWTAEEFLNCAN